MPTYKCDVAIIGAGPAGSTCASYLARNGVSVALIDAHNFPRDKICGDAIPGPAVKILEELDPNAELSLNQFSIIQESEIITGKSEAVELKWKSKAFNVKREFFDDHLLSIALKDDHVTFYPGERVKEVVPSDHKVSIFTSNRIIEAEYLVGADGVNSMVRNSVLKNSQLNLCSAVRQYYRSSTPITKANQFYLLKDILPGYFWIFPIGNNEYNIGLGILDNSPKGKKMNLNRVLKDLTQSNPIIQPLMKNAEAISPVKAFGLPIYHKNQAMSINRTLLIGDAAQLVDPLQGHGIDKAMISAKVAAKHVTKALSSGNTDLSKYDHEIHSTLGKELLRNYRIMKTINRYPIALKILSNLARIKPIKSFLKKHYA